MKYLYLLLALIFFACSGSQYTVEYSEIKDMYDFSEDLAAVNVGGKFGYINTKGKFVIEPLYSFAGYFKNSIAPVKIQNKFGFIDDDGKMIIPAEFEEARTFSYELAPVRKNGLWGYIDTDGDIQIKYQFLNAKSFSESYAAVQTNDGWGYIKLNGKIEIKPNYLEAGNFVRGKAPVKSKENNLWGYINKSGKFKIEPIYDYAGDFVSIKHKEYGDKYLALVEDDGKWGYIDEGGKYYINPEYEDAKPFSGYYASVKKDGKWGMINYKNKNILDFNYDEAGFFSSDLLLVVHNGQKYYITESGKDAGVLKIKAPTDEQTLGDAPKNCLSCIWGTKQYCRDDCWSMIVSFLNLTNENVILTTDNSSSINTSNYNNVKIPPGQFFTPQNTEPKGTINVSIELPEYKWINSGLNTFIFTKVFEYGNSLYTGGKDMNNSGVLYKSVDGGSRWNEVSSVSSLSIESSICGIAVQNNSIFIASKYQYIFRSDDECKTWKQLSNGLSSNVTNILSANGYLYASFYKYGYEGIAISGDNGETWNATKFNRWTVNSFASAGNSVFAVVSYYQDETQSGIYRTTDNGNSWLLVFKNAYIGCINSDGKTLICNDSRYLYVSDDNGNTWKSVLNSPPSTKVTETYVKDMDIYCTAVLSPELSVLYKSPDRGTTWNSISGNIFQYEIKNVTFYNRKMFAFSGTDLYAYAPDTTSKHVVKYASINLNRVLLHTYRDPFEGYIYNYYTNTLSLSGNNVTSYGRYSGVNNIGSPVVNAYVSRNSDYTIWAQNVNFKDQRGYDCDEIGVNPVTISIEYTDKPRIRQYP